MAKQPRVLCIRNFVFCQAVKSCKCTGVGGNRGERNKENSNKALFVEISKYFFVRLRFSLFSCLSILFKVLLLPVIFFLIFYLLHNT